MLLRTEASASRTARRGDALRGDHDQLAGLAFFFEVEHKIEIGIEGGNVLLKEEKIAFIFRHFTHSFVGIICVSTIARGYYNSLGDL